MNRLKLSHSFFALITAGAALFALGGTAFSQQFSDVSVAAGLHRDATRSWGNPLWCDFNNDGKLDLIVSNHEAPSGVAEGGVYPYIYENNGDGTFTDVQPTSGVVEQDPDTGAWQGISVGDYDGDGNLDIFISEPPFQGMDLGTTSNLLFKGHGDGTWEYASREAGLPIDREYSECSFFVDYDNDGKLDIFVKNIPDTTAVNSLYRNNGDGTFESVPGAAGLDLATQGRDLGSIVSFADYDNDGWMDVVMGGNGSPEGLYHNNRDGTYTDVTEDAGLKPKGFTQGLAWGDYNNDGLLDLYISRGGGATMTNTLYRNTGNGTFSDVTSSAGVNDDTNTWAAVWGDYDNDGLIDLFVARPGTSDIGVGNANILYHNNGDGTFTDVAAAEGVALQDDQITSAHKLAAWGDYNDDGFLDLVVKDGISPGLLTGDAFKGLHYLFKNNGGTNHYIKLFLQGVQSNLNGIGARVAVTYDGGLAFRENNGGGGGEWGSQGANPCHFGIGSAETATVRITWPSGIVDVVDPVAADSTLTVVEGSSPAPVVSENISTRLDVMTGDNIGIGGFIINGSAPKKVLIRGLGPSLEGAGIPNFLADPVVELIKPNGPMLQNDNWMDTQVSDIAATGLAPANESEAAIVANLDPGPYTVFLTGQNATSGVGLIEVYDLDQGITSELANVSTRGFVGTGDSVMIGGIIIGPLGAAEATVIVRAIGPTLAANGVSHSLADPFLELRDSNGTLVAANDNWQDDPSQAASIEGEDLAPGDPRESAIYATLPTGGYTAVVQGKDNTTGVALVEAYNIK